MQVLAADFGFKDAVASGDAETIRSALANHGARINASVVMMLSLDGRLEVSTDQQVSEQTAKRLSAQVVQRQREGVQIFLMPIADKIYLLVQATVTAPLPIARVMMGFQVDEAFATELRELTHLDLTLVASQPGQADIWISTLMPAEREQLRVAVGGMNGDAIRVLGSQQYLNQNLVLGLFQVRAQRQQDFIHQLQHIKLSTVFVRLIHCNLFKATDQTGCALQIAINDTEIFFTLRQKLCQL